MVVKLETYEKEQRKRNLVMKGLRVDVNIQQAYKINDRACIVQTEDLEENMRILKVKSKLKQAQAEVFIDSDFSESERNVQRLIEE